MQLHIPQRIAEHLCVQLRHAGGREIGGIIFGEQLSEGAFKVLAMTAQTAGGTSNSFHRQGRQARKQVLRLHEQFGEEPSRFNYMGEWHSHPNALAIPSIRDELTMLKLLREQGDAVNFLILLIARLADLNTLEVGAVAYLISGQKIDCSINLYDEPKEEQ